MSLTLTGDSTYTGGTTISAGTLQVGTSTNSAKIGTGSIVNSGSLVFMDGTNTVTDTISGSGTLTIDSGTLILAGNNTYTGTTTVTSSGTLKIGNAGTTGILGSGTVSGAGVLIFNRSNNFAVSNTLSGSLDLKQQGSGVVTVAGNNTYTGTTTIDAGKTLRLGSNSAIGTGIVTLNGTLDLGGYSETIGKLTGASTGKVTSSVASSSVINIDNSESFEFLGLIEDGSGSVALAKQGTGTLTLTGANTYSAGTTISAGILQVGDNNAAGTLGTGAVVNNASLVFDRTGTTTVTNDISGSGSLTQNRGTVILTGNNTYTGITTIVASSIASRTLQIGDGGETGTLGSGAVGGGSGSNAGMLIFNRSNNITVGNTISGRIDIRQQGTGQLTLSGDISGTASIALQTTGDTVLAGNNSYTGGTTITSIGTLQIARRKRPWHGHSNG